MNTPMRRKDRETTKEEALAIADRSPWAVLSVTGENSDPYCIPISLVRDGDWFYFHCAREGHKLDLLRAKPRVCISFVGNTEFPQNSFTVFYESAVVFGTAEEVNGNDEKIQGLRILCKRFTPGNMNAFDEEVNRLFGRTAVWKIHIDQITGKRRAQS